MNKKDFNDFMGRAFGPEKDEKTHARAMLAIYVVFIIAVIIYAKTLPKPKADNQTTNNSGANNVVDPTPTPTATPDNGNVTPTSSPTPSNNTTTGDINYSYSYTINYDGVTEVYLGKRIDDKQKFSYTKDGKTLEYAIKDDNYLLEENGVYHIVDKLDTYFKYCNVEKILSLLAHKSVNPETGLYVVTNEEIKELFGDIADTYSAANTIKLDVVGNTLNSITLDLSNYIHSVDNNINSLNINMEFANVGKVEDFEIKMN